jgi:hypothetical protein
VTRRNQASIAADRTAIKGMETDVAYEPRISINALVWSARPQGRSRHPCSNATLILSAPADGTSAGDWGTENSERLRFADSVRASCACFYVGTWGVEGETQWASHRTADHNSAHRIRLVQYQRPRPYQPPLSTKMISTITRSVVVSMRVFLRHEWSQAAYCVACNSGWLTTCRPSFGSGARPVWLFLSPTQQIRAKALLAAPIHPQKRWSILYRLVFGLRHRVCRTTFGSFPTIR